MKHFSLPVITTANYYTLGEISPNIKEFWIVCHGYAQTADEFLLNFKDLEDGTRYIVAPEGLNNFYKKGMHGDPTALWMTKRNRESQINDYCNYLQKLYDLSINSLPDKVRIVLLGFSQGTATITRWVMNKNPHFHDLILWAGLPPEDVDYSAKKDYLISKNMYLLYGTSDPFINEKHLETVNNIEKINQIEFDEFTFDGGHEIPKLALQNFIDSKIAQQ
jgi:predicted esterase